MKSFSTLASIGLAAAPLVSARVSHDGKTRRDFGFGGGNKAVHAPRDINVVGDNNVVGGGGSSDASSVWGGHGFSGSWEGSSFNNQPPIIVVWANPGGEAATTQIEQQVTVTQTVTAPPAAGTPPPAAAATHTVMVGGDDLVYTPDQLNNVPIGDMVVFQFMQQNHTVTQSGFDTPCEAMEGGMDTEHQPNPDNSVEPPPQVAMQVTTTDPLCKHPPQLSQPRVHQLTPPRVLLQDCQPLRHGHGLLHQPHC